MDAYAVGALLFAFFCGALAGVMIVWLVSKFLRRPEDER